MTTLSYLRNLERSARGMSEDEFLRSLMKACGYEIAKILCKFGTHGEISKPEQRRLDLWKRSKEGKKIMALFDKHGG